jgi:hypothetical protein
MHTQVSALSSGSKRSKGSRLMVQKSCVVYSTLQFSQHFACTGKLPDIENNNLKHAAHGPLV